jgi:predicted nucleic acid-binding protein
MIYLDTSYIVKCYVREPGTEAILAWLEGQAGLSCAWHGRLEFCTAVQRHVREKRILPADGRRVFRRLETDERGNLWNWIPLSPELLRAACARVEGLAPQVPLRSADALHLTCAAVNGFQTVYSHDRHLLAAAPHFGLEGRDILAD